MGENLGKERRGEERNGKRGKDLISAVLYDERQSDLNKIFNERHFFPGIESCPHRQTMSLSSPFFSLYPCIPCFLFCIHRL